MPKRKLQRTNKYNSARYLATSVGLPLSTAALTAVLASGVVGTPVALADEITGDQPNVQQTVDQSLPAPSSVDQQAAAEEAARQQAAAEEAARQQAAAEEAARQQAAAEEAARQQAAAEEAARQQAAAEEAARQQAAAEEAARQQAAAEEAARQQAAAEEAARQQAAAEEAARQQAAAEEAAKQQAAAEEAAKQQAAEEATQPQAAEEAAQQAAEEATQPQAAEEAAQQAAAEEAAKQQAAEEAAKQQVAEEATQPQVAIDDVQESVSNDNAIVNTEETQDVTSDSQSSTQNMDDESYSETIIMGTGDDEASVDSNVSENSTVLEDVKNSENSSTSENQDVQNDVEVNETEEAVNESSNNNQVTISNNENKEEQATQENIPNPSVQEENTDDESYSETIIMGTGDDEALVNDPTVSTPSYTISGDGYTVFVKDGQYNVVGNISEDELASLDQELFEKYGIDEYNLWNNLSQDQVNDLGGIGVTVEVDEQGNLTLNGEGIDSVVELDKEGNETVIEAQENPNVVNPDKYVISKNDDGSYSLALGGVGLSNQQLQDLIERLKDSGKIPQDAEVIANILPSGVTQGQANNGETDKTVQIGDHSHTSSIGHDGYVVEDNGGNKVDMTEENGFDKGEGPQLEQNYETSNDSDAKPDLKPSEPEPTPTPTPTEPGDKPGEDTPTPSEPEPTPTPSEPEPTPSRPEPIVPSYNTPVVSNNLAKTGSGLEGVMTLAALSGLAGVAALLKKRQLALAKDDNKYKSIVMDPITMTRMLDNMNSALDKVNVKTR